MSRNSYPAQRFWDIEFMEPPSVAKEGQSTPGRFGPLLCLTGFLLIGLAALWESWAVYYYQSTGLAESFFQLQNTLFEWAIVASILIGSGALLAAVGWIGWDRTRILRWGAPAPTPALRSGVGFVLVGLRAAMIAGEEYFNALTTYAALRGAP